MDSTNQDILNTMDIDTDLDTRLLDDPDSGDDIGYYYLRLTSDVGDVWLSPAEPTQLESDEVDDDDEEDEEDEDDELLLSDEEFEGVLSLNTELDMLLDTVTTITDLDVVIAKIKLLLNNFGFILPNFELQTEFLHNVYDIELFDKLNTYCWLLHVETEVEPTGTFLVFAGVIPVT